MDKKFCIVVLLFLGIIILSFTSVNSLSITQIQSSTREKKVQREVCKQIVVFQDYVKDTLFYEVNQDRIDVERVRRAFLKSRLLFKKFEWATAYFTSDLNNRLNGPPVQEVENADLLDPSLARAIDPMGLQVIEEFIYTDIDTIRNEQLISEVGHLITNTGYLISYFADNELADWRILDAAKLEVFRIITMGITGFENALSLNSMRESSTSLASLRSILGSYSNKRAPLLQDLDHAISYLNFNTDFNSFDRAAFITRFGNQISTGIAQLEKDLPGPKIHYNRMLRQEVRTLFDLDAFNVDAFSPGPQFQLTEAKIGLGEKLFYDVQLSGNGTRSCASCHNPDLAFSDGLAKPYDLHDSTKPLSRNVPTLLNVALQSNYFYDMRALTIEDQVLHVINNKQEMDGSIEDILHYVSTNKSYQSLFEAAFPGKTISSEQMTNALAAYTRSLVNLNSRFDAYMRGNVGALSKQELSGFNLFMGKAKCATCHFVPLFNGIAPPKYVTSETEVLGVPVSPLDSNLDSDLGYYSIIGVESYQHAFKTPTVRNIKKTAPYMHNGIYWTLDEVMVFYNNGGGIGLGINLPNQTLSSDSLKLNEKEQQDIIAFMESLESI